MNIDISVIQYNAVIGIIGKTTNVSGGFRRIASTATKHVAACSRGVACHAINCVHADLAAFYLDVGVLVHGTIG